VFNNVVKAATAVMVVCGFGAVYWWIEQRRVEKARDKERSGGPGTHR